VEGDGDGDAGDFCLGFVFEDWLDPETFTSHAAAEFELEQFGVKVRQGQFLHTKQDDHTGAVVWDDAVIVARHLAAKFGVDSTCSTAGGLRGRPVIDLGTGTGFLGLAVARACAAKVIVSDRAVMADLVRANVDANRDAVAAAGGSCEFAEHSWGEALSGPVADAAPFAAILVSGCVYHEEANPPLLDSIMALSDENTLVVVAIDFRFDVARARDEDEDEYISPVLASFLSQAADRGLAMRAQPNDQLGLPADHVKNSVRVYHARRAAEE